MADTSEKLDLVTRENRAASFRRLAEAPPEHDVVIDLVDGPSPVSCAVGDDGAVLVVVSEEGGVYARLEPQIAAQLALEMSWAAIEGTQLRMRARKAAEQEPADG